MQGSLGKTQVGLYRLAAHALPLSDPSGASSHEPSDLGFCSGFGIGGLGIS